MQPINLLLLLLMTTIFLSGCVGIVSGDLADINKNKKLSLPYCDVQAKTYQLNVRLGGKYSGRKFAAELSSATLGIIPTYQFTNVYSEVIITRNDVTVFTKGYKSKVHGFYGLIPWLTLAPFLDDSSKRLSLENHDHIGIPLGIRWRSYRKALQELPKNIDLDDICYQRTPQRPYSSLKQGDLFYQLQQTKKKAKK